MLLVQLLLLLALPLRIHPPSLLELQKVLEPVHWLPLLLPLLVPTPQMHLLLKLGLLERVVLAQFLPLLFRPLQDPLPTAVLYL